MKKKARKRKIDDANDPTLQANGHLKKVKERKKKTRKSGQTEGQNRELKMERGTRSTLKRCSTGHSTFFLGERSVLRYEKRKKKE